MHQNQKLAGLNSRSRRSRARLRITVILTIICTLAAGSIVASISMANAHDGNQQTGWHGVDDPRLDEPDSGGGWWRVASNSGVHGDYHYTYGDRSLSRYENRAVWEMGHRHGRQVIYVHVPKLSTVRATVRYRIYKNDVLIETVSINQDENKGWQRLGWWDFNGAKVRIEARDNETAEIYDGNNPNDSRMGIDKISMKCSARCAIVGEDPSQVSQLYKEYVELRSDYQALKNSSTSYKNCISRKSSDLSGNLFELAHLLDVESTSSLLTGLIPIIGNLGNAIIYNESNLTDAVRALASEIGNEFGC